MSLAGNLQDLALTDIFQIIGMSGKSGWLMLEQRDGVRGKVCFSKGKIVGAWGPISLTIIADLLSSEKILMPNLLTRIESGPGDPLAEFRTALHLSALAPDRRERFLERFVETTVLELLKWRIGTFQFDMTGNHPSESPLDPALCLLSVGVDPNHLGLESARRMDEHVKSSEVPEKTPRLPATEPLIDLVDELREEFESKGKERPALSPGLTHLKSMLFELSQPNVHTYIVLLVLRYAATLMNRALLFEIREQEFLGVGEFGLSSDKSISASRVRNIRIPRTEPSILNVFGEDLLPMKTKPDLHRPWDKAFYEVLGGDVPAEVFIGPITCQQRPVALLYGDNLPESRLIGDTESLEIFLSQAGLAMDRALALQASS